MNIIEKRQGEGAEQVLQADLSHLPQPKYRNSESPFCYRYEPVPELRGLPGSRARLGQLSCPHGNISTPNFIFCATKANVKAMSQAALRAAQSDIVLCNTYHLMLSPGAELIARQGGVHQFMRWDGPLLSDSGGYQVFAMGHGSVSEEIKGRRKFGYRSNGGRKLLNISEKGVNFRSYVDGAKVFLSPERSIAIQRQLGVDFMVQFDECTPYHASRDYTEASMELSLRWGARSLAEFIAGDDGKQAIYGVVQGGIYADLRRRSAAGVRGLPFFGTAIGGCLGKTREQMWQVTSDTAPLLPRERPIHLLGIGHIADIFWGVLQGIDTFDCVHPTRLARHGCAILPFASVQAANRQASPGLQSAQIHLRQSRYREDSRPLFGATELFQPSAKELPDELSYSKAYVQHLLRTGEMLGAQILTINNVFQMNALMRDIRLALRENCLGEILRYWLGLSLEEFCKESFTGERTGELN